MHKLWHYEVQALAYIQHLAWIKFKCSSCLLERWICTSEFWIVSKSSDIGPRVWFVPKYMKESNCILFQCADCNFSETYRWRFQSLLLWIWCFTVTCQSINSSSHLQDSVLQVQTLHLHRWYRYMYVCVLVQNKCYCKSGRGHTTPTDGTGIFHQLVFLVNYKDDRLES